MSSAPPLSVSSPAAPGDCDFEPAAVATGVVLRRFVVLVGAGDGESSLRRGLTPLVERALRRGSGGGCQRSLRTVAVRMGQVRRTGCFLPAMVEVSGEGE